jgi:hypothetical protein
MAGDLDRRTGFSGLTGGGERAGLDKINKIYRIQKTYNKTPKT